MNSVKVNGWAMICWQGTALNRVALIGGTTNHRLSLQRQTIEKASPVSARAREYLPGLSSWSLSIDKMVLMSEGGSDIWGYIEALKAGSSLNVCVQVGLDYFEGTALIESANVSAPFRGKATANLSLRGTGALEMVDVSNWGFTFTLPMAFDAALAQENETETND